MLIGLTWHAGFKVIHLNLFFFSFFSLFIYFIYLYIYSRFILIFTFRAPDAGVLLITVSYLLLRTIAPALPASGRQLSSIIGIATASYIVLH